MTSHDFDASDYPLPEDDQAQRQAEMSDAWDDECWWALQERQAAEMAAA